MQLTEDERRQLVALRESLAQITHHTVVFEGSLQGITVSPFDIVSPFGEPVACGYGNAFEEADAFREALEEIAEKTSDPEIALIAEQALSLDLPKKAGA